MHIHFFIIFDTVIEKFRFHEMKCSNTVRHRHWCTCNIYYFWMTEISCHFMFIFIDLNVFLFQVTMDDTFRMDICLNEWDVNIISSLNLQFYEWIVQMLLWFEDKVMNWSFFLRLMELRSIVVWDLMIILYFHEFLLMLFPNRMFIL